MQSACAWWLSHTQQWLGEGGGGGRTVKRLMWAALGEDDKKINKNRSAAQPWLKSVARKEEKIFNKRLAPATPPSVLSTTFISWLLLHYTTTRHYVNCWIIQLGRRTWRGKQNGASRERMLVFSFTVAYIRVLYGNSWFMYQVEI